MSRIDEVDNTLAMLSLRQIKDSIKNHFGKKIISIRLQCDLFPGYDELSVLLEGNEVHACLLKDSIQESDWKFIPPPEAKR